MKFHVVIGIAARREKTSMASTGAKFSFALRSLVHCQLGVPGSRLQYWVTAPVVPEAAINAGAVCPRAYGSFRLLAAACVRTLLPS